MGRMKEKWIEEYNHWLETGEADRALVESFERHHMRVNHPEWAVVHAVYCPCGVSRSFGGDPLVQRLDKSERTLWKCPNCKREISQATGGIVFTPMSDEDLKRLIEMIESER